MSSIEQHNEVVAGLQPFIKENLNILKPAEKLWHPSDLLPNPTDKNYIEKVAELRSSAANLSDELIAVFVGNAVTEEALPTYSALLNRIEPLKDPTGIDQSPFSQWIRGWVAEEKRHDVVMDRYASLSGRVNMRAMEITTHGLISKGFDPGVDGDPYKGIAFVAYQEGGTELPHKRTGRLAKEQGDSLLFRLCGYVAGDENRHETFYSKLYGAIFQIDPEGATIAFWQLINTGLRMPGSPMDNFTNYAALAQKTGIFTTKDYVELIIGLIKKWHILDLPLSGEAAKAQEELSKYTPEYAVRRNEIMMRKVNRLKIPPIEWVVPRAA